MNNNNNNNNTGGCCVVPRLSRMIVGWMCVVVFVQLLGSTTLRSNAFVINTSSITTSSTSTTISSTSHCCYSDIRCRPTTGILGRHIHVSVSQLSSTSTTTEDEDMTTSSSSSSSVTSSSFLPDYGTTPVEIDQIQIVKKKWRRPELFGQSLIEQTLNEISGESSSSSSSQQPYIPLTKEERTAQRRSLRQAQQVPNFAQHVHAMAATTTSSTSSSSSSSSPLQLLHRKSVPTILQINIGLYCNQACHHCHGMFL